MVMISILGIAPLQIKTCLKNDLNMDILFRKGMRVIYGPWIYEHEEHPPPPPCRCYVVWSWYRTRNLTCESASSSEVKNIISTFLLQSRVHLTLNHFCFL